MKQATPFSVDQQQLNATAHSLSNAMNISSTPIDEISELLEHYFQDRAHLQSLRLLSDETVQQIELFRDHMIPTLNRALAGTLLTNADLDPGETAKSFPAEQFDQALDDLMGTVAPAEPPSPVSQDITQAVETICSTVDASENKAANDKARELIWTFVHDWHKISSLYFFSSMDDPYQGTLTGEYLRISANYIAGAIRDASGATGPWICDPRQPEVTEALLAVFDDYYENAAARQ